MINVLWLGGGHQELLALTVVQLLLLPFGLFFLHPKDQFHLVPIANSLNTLEQTVILLLFSLLELFLSYSILLLLLLLLLLHLAFDLHLDDLPLPGPVVIGQFLLGIELYLPHLLMLEGIEIELQPRRGNLRKGLLLNQLQDPYHFPVRQVMDQLRNVQQLLLIIILLVPFLASVIVTACFPDIRDLSGHLIDALLHETQGIGELCFLGVLDQELYLIDHLVD